IASLFLTLTAAPSAAVAEENNDVKAAKAHYQNAVKRYTLGKYKEALAEFEAAYLSKPDPAFLFNMGQGDPLLGEHEAAAKAYRTYLEKLPQAPNRRDAELFIADMDKEIAKKAMEEKPTPAAPVVEAPPPVEQPPPPPPEKPIYKKWWLWAAAGGAL